MRNEFGSAQLSRGVAFLSGYTFTGLYSGAIMLSGSSLNSWALTRRPLKFARSVASSLGIRTENITNMVEGLKKLSAKIIQEVTVSKFNRVS